MQIKQFDNTRKLKNYVNINNISKDDIVSIFVLGNYIYLSYYGEDYGEE